MILGELFDHYPSLVLVLSSAVVLSMGVLAHALSARLKVPAILFMLGFGILLGPECIGLIQPEYFGAGLRALVSISVAIIVFEGALLIDARHLKHYSRSVVGLITVGALVTFVLGTVTAHYVAGIPWKLACLFGSIISVTGPTVILPILKRLPVHQHLKTILEAESVFVDAIGVLLTASVFSYITGSADGIVGGFAQIAINLSIGLAVGGVTAFIVKLTSATKGIVPQDLSRVAVLSAVLLGYSVAETIAHESGIAAVAVAGLMIGSMGLPEAANIKRFKGDLTTIALSIVFILLAANMQFGSIHQLGWKGIAVALIVMAVIRPVAVFVATWRSGLSLADKAFIAWMGPRGIVAVSMASLITLELKAWGMAGADVISAMVFIVVISTVTLQGGLAGMVANKLGLIRKKVLVIGCDEVARKLSLQLIAEGEVVVLLDSSTENVHAALACGLQALEGDAANAEDLVRAGISWCHTVVAATSSDKANLLICQACKHQDPKLRMIARVSDEKNEGVIRDSGIEPLLMSDAAAMTLTAMVTRPTLLPLLNSTSGTDRVIEVRVGNPKVNGMPLEKLKLPAECLIALIKRDGELRIPKGHTTLAMGDTVTLIGERRAIDESRNLIEATTPDPAND